MKKTVFLIMMVAMVAMPSICLAEDINEFSDAPSSDTQVATTTTWSQPVQTGEKVGEMKTVDQSSSSQIFTVHDWVPLDPVAVVAQGKYEELNKGIVKVYSLRRSKVVDGKIAYDLQTDWCWPGEFTRKVKIVHGVLEINPQEACHNKVVALESNKLVVIKCDSTCIKQVQEIIKYYNQRCEQQYCPPPREEPAPCQGFVRPTGILAVQSGCVEYRYNPGFVRVDLGAQWLLGLPDTNISNSQSQTAKGGEGGKGGAGGNVGPITNNNANSNTNVNPNNNVINVGSGSASGSDTGAGSSNAGSGNKP